MARTIAIGEQDFGKIIENKYFYIDKSHFIKDWWENGDNVTLITRPRRFGKTLTMNMLYYFFSVNFADRHTLFEGLNIWKDYEKDFFLKVREDMSDVTAARALKRLSDILHKYYKKRVIILLDEYDTPLQEAYINGYWDEMSEFMRSIMNATFKTNQDLERAIMTGITRVSKESIFSDLNNLITAAVTSRLYETVFGFAEEEVFQSLKEFGLQDEADEVKR